MNTLRNRLIVSCQAAEGDPFHDPATMARFARAAVDAGAAAIRANGPADIQAIRGAVDVPIIGIQKRVHEDGAVLITGSFDEAAALVAAGASMIALDCTARGQRLGALDRMRRIREELRVPALADIAMISEARDAAAAGADFVLSTLRGYTEETAGVTRFEPDFIAELARGDGVPVIAEGRIETPEQARDALDAGAFAVVVGSAITRPADIARRFVRVMDRRETALVAGIDLGGTNTKFGLVGGRGAIAHEGTEPTPRGGRDVLLDHLKRVGRRCLDLAEAKPLALGVATAGWVNPHTGRVAYATENLPGWTGTDIAGELRAALGVPVAVENDANALAVAEKHFGAARGARDFVCITLGTGVGGGCYVGGRMNSGGHFFANAIGHMPLVPDGLPCSCGQRGCLEMYANAAALVRYAGDPALASAEDVILAANAGALPARRAIATFAQFLARGCAGVVQLLDPELIVFSGGVAQNNPLLLPALEEELSRIVTVWPQRGLNLRISDLGYHGGVLGAAAIALERL
ncbi:MAG: putative N-acetylmannosamine-6-phosphate 2-epimerase [Bryobacterales bacterium]|nr:putative N-acetylmannosamine-6-phosphate 2-epimerase [Bryobacterales bacterium]